MGEPSTDRTPIHGTRAASLITTGEFDNEVDAVLEQLDAADAGETFLSCDVDSAANALRSTIGGADAEVEDAIARLESTPAGPTYASFDAAASADPTWALKLADTGEFARELDAALERLETADESEPSLLDSGEVHPVFDRSSRHHTEAISGRMYLLAQEELEAAARREQAPEPSGSFEVLASAPTPSLEQEQLAELPWSLRQHVVAPVETERGFLRGAIAGAVIALIGCVATAAFLVWSFRPQPEVAPSAGVAAAAPATTGAATQAAAPVAPPVSSQPQPSQRTDAKAATAQLAPAPKPAAKAARAETVAPVAKAAPIAKAAQAPAAPVKPDATGKGSKVAAKQDVADPELAAREDAEPEVDPEAAAVQAVEAEAIEVTAVKEEPLTEAERAVLDRQKLNDAFDQEFGETEETAAAGATEGEAKKTVFIPPAVPEVPENLSQSDVLQVVVSRKDEIAECVKANAASIVADAPRTMTVQWTVHPDGTTSAITVESETYKGSALGGCFAARIAQWTFPKHQVQQPAIRFPFTF